MNANDYCSAPPPLFLLRHTSYKAPLLQCISIRCTADEKKQPVLVSVVTSTGKWW